MQQQTIYSSLFTTPYDEQEPIGFLGRGTHYSILRSVEWLDVTLKASDRPFIHDFAVVWDEDHDTRVVETLEQIYLKGLLPPLLFAGERKGTLTVIVDYRFYDSLTELEFDKYKQEIENILNEFVDPWPLETGTFDIAAKNDHDFSFATIIADSDNKVENYLKNIQSLWDIGLKESQA